MVWLQPYPDQLLDEIAPSADQPDAVAVDRETIELAFLVALQSLPARQRAALIARDVLGWSANDTAELLETSVAAANSALQRARATMQQRLPARRTDWAAPRPTAEERDVLDRFIDAHERCDAAAAIAIAAEDLRVSMPPDQLSFAGLAACVPLLERAFGPDRDGDWRLVPTSANRLPAAASYLRRPGDTVFRAFKLDVLRINDGAIAEITTFGYSRFPAFGLPPTQSDDLVWRHAGTTHGDPGLLVRPGWCAHRYRRRARRRVEGDVRPVPPRLRGAARDPVPAVRRSRGVRRLRRRQAAGRRCP